MARGLITCGTGDSSSDESDSNRQETRVCFCTCLVYFVDGEVHICVRGVIPGVDLCLDWPRLCVCALQFSEAFDVFIFALFPLSLQNIEQQQDSRIEEWVLCWSGYTGKTVSIRFNVLVSGTARVYPQRCSNG